MVQLSDVRVDQVRDLGAEVEAEGVVVVVVDGFLVTTIGQILRRLIPNIRQMVAIVKDGDLDFGQVPHLEDWPLSSGIIVGRPNRESIGISGIKFLCKAHPVRLVPGRRRDVVIMMIVVKDRRTSGV
jgi:hypothetical protein